MLTRVVNSRNSRMRLQKASNSHRVSSMALTAQAQCLHANEKLLCGSWVQRRPNFHQDVEPQGHGKGNDSKRLPVREAHGPVFLEHLWEAVASLVPVKGAAVDDDAANDCAVTAHPLGSRVQDDVGTKVNGSAPGSASTEDVVHLHVCYVRKDPQWTRKHLPRMEVGFHVLSQLIRKGQAHYSAGFQWSLHKRAWFCRLQAEQTPPRFPMWPTWLWFRDAGEVSWRGCRFYRRGWWTRWCCRWLQQDIW